MNDPAAPATVAATRALDLALARGMLVVALFSVVASTARVAQDAAIAWRYGAGSQVDAYYFVLSLVSWPVAAVLSTLTMRLAPMHASMRLGPPEAAARFRSELFGAVLLAALASLPLTWWVLPTIAGGPVGGLPADTATQAVASFSAKLNSISMPPRKSFTCDRVRGTS